MHREIMLSSIIYQFHALKVYAECVLAFGAIGCVWCHWVRLVPLVGVEAGCVEICVSD